MTAIWDTLGYKASLLSEGKLDEGQTAKLKTVISMIYDVIKDQEEYGNEMVWSAGEKKKLLPTLELITKEPKWDWQVGQLLYEIIQTLHDFDHKDIPIKKKPTFGHHTEQLIIKKKYYVEMLRNVFHDFWWKGEVI